MEPVWIAIGASLLGVSGAAVWSRRRAPNAASRLACSFCGKDQREVAKLIAGPNVYICDGCVALCAEILAADLTVPATPPGGGTDPWSPPG